MISAAFMIVTDEKQSVDGEDRMIGVIRVLFGQKNAVSTVVCLSNRIIITGTISTNAFLSAIYYATNPLHDVLASMIISILRSFSLQPYQNRIR